MSLRDDIKNIQRATGAEVDGVFGPGTAAAVLRALSRSGVVEAEAANVVELDARTGKVLDTLDVKARPMFERFMRLAKATAATLGCDYVLISGNRTWAEQDVLYAQGRTKPGKVVTKAKGGQSNHNFGIAVDAGVFLGGIYLDGGTKEQAARAAKVHKACSEHAAACGLEWGGSWTGFKDLPHYEVRTGMTMDLKRARFKQKGSVL